MAARTDPRAWFEGEYGKVTSATGEFAVHMGEALGALPPEVLTRHLHHTVGRTKDIFQKWTLEIVYLLAIRHTLRFGEMKRLLHGISSRTLSNKLAELEELGFVSRRVHEGKPLRVDYKLTKKGFELARFVTPVVVFLSLDYVKRVAGLPTANAEQGAATAGANDH
jgi:DNA-binding HxlR family transcriptional regulator